MAATLTRRKTAGLGVGFPTALFSGGVEEENIDDFCVHNFIDTWLKISWYYYPTTE
jgi:hypothetical protein